MQLISEKVMSKEGYEATLSGYVIDNSEEMHPHRVRPTVLVLPGGGFARVSDREAEPIAERFVGMGYNAFILRYSCAPARYPVAIEQVISSVKKIRDNAEQWNVEPNSIVVAGFSAGGLLAAQFATAWESELVTGMGYAPESVKPNGLMLGYPVISSGEYAHRGTFENLLGTKADDEQLLEQLSIEKQVNSHVPTTFLWHTMTDSVVPVENSLLFIKALKNHGISVEAHLFPQGGHGLSLATEETSPVTEKKVEKSVQVWVDLFSRWMRRNFTSRDAQ